MKTNLLAFLAIAMLLVTGCPSTPPEQPDKYCKGAEKLVAAYEASLPFRQPTEDETKAYLAAKAILIAFCGRAGDLIPVDASEKSIGTLPLPRQPKRIVTKDTGERVIYYLKIPFSIIQDPTGIYPKTKDGLATITIGPLYKTADSVRRSYLWQPDAAWLQGLGKEPHMNPVR